MSHTQSHDHCRERQGECPGFVVRKNRNNGLAGTSRVDVLAAEILSHTKLGESALLGTQTASVFGEIRQHWVKNQTLVRVHARECISHDNSLAQLTKAKAMVKEPSMMNSHRHARKPALPSIPSRTPAAI